LPGHAGPGQPGQRLVMASSAWRPGSRPACSGGDGGTREAGKSPSRTGSSPGSHRRGRRGRRRAGGSVFWRLRARVPAGKMVVAAATRGAGARFLQQGSNRRRGGVLQHAGGGWGGAKWRGRPAARARVSQASLQGEKERVREEGGVRGRERRRQWSLSSSREWWRRSWPRTAGRWHPAAMALPGSCFSFERKMTKGYLGLGRDGLRLGGKRSRVGPEMVQKTESCIFFQKHFSFCFQILFC
jgi:hypothetical protein